MSILKQLQAEIKAKGFPMASRSARTWLHSKIRELSIKHHTISGESDRQRRNAHTGKLYFFYYDPKTKEKLPYYDIFPLVIPIERCDNGFLGLNLHYVEPKIRLRILDTLCNNLSNAKLDDTTRMKINYNLITSLASADFFKPCIKRYLWNNIQSKRILIGAEEWHLAALLPFENFKKKTKTYVFAESRDQIFKTNRNGKINP